MPVENQSVTCYVFGVVWIVTLKYLISFGEATDNPKRAEETKPLGSNLEQQFLVRRNTEHLLSSEKSEQSLYSHMETQPPHYV